MKEKRKVIRTPNSKRTRTMNQEKYELVSKWILRTLTHEGMRWGDLVDKVAAKIKNFEGSIPHCVIPCLRELESQGKVKREPGPPVLYTKKK